MSGSVYFIHTADFSAYYVGSTGKIKTRRKHHLAALRVGKHHCQPLQRTFAKHGEDALIFSVAATTETRQAASELEHELLGFHFRKPGCLNVSSNGLMPAQCPEVVARRNATLKGQAHREKASTAAKAWRAANPERATAADAKSAATRRNSPAWGAANAERVRAINSTPEAVDAFKKRMERHRQTGALNGFAKAVIRIGNDGTQVRFASAAEAARATPGSHFGSISRCCLGQGKSSGGYGWWFA